MLHPDKKVKNIFGLTPTPLQRRGNWKIKAEISVAY